ncbi:hypothetical protein ACTMTJ_21675 [Phytohabitans sp. LJ34]|uniref:hypothetical protein n=1 Tax=Phytohabitans sp. LJ34 TaxID=3452217 RepID=UPI003F8B0291
MTYLKRLLLLALPVVAVVSMGTPAIALPASMSYIYNKPENRIGIGVIYSWPTTANYDAILPAGQRTDGPVLDWQGAGGFYIGAGYCADPYYFSTRDGGWRWYGWPGQAVTVRGPQKYPTKTVIAGESTARNEIRDLRPC